MATMLGSLLVSLGLESGEFKSGLDAAEKQMRSSAKRIERIGRDMANTGKNLSLAVTAPLAAMGVASFKAASDAAELESAFKQTFGSLSREMEAWAVTTGDAMGRSTQELQKAANTFGIFFNQAAPTKQAAADLSKQFTILAQDLSSFYNTSPEVALQKLRSGLSGESEPLRDFGVFLNEATVSQKALQMGLAATSKELTDQDKILARANLIMEATANAQGDVARTSDGTANRVRAAKAAFEEMQVAIGQKLLPALTPLINGLANLLNQFNRLPSGVQTAIVVTAGFAAALGPVMFIVGNLIKLFGPFYAAVVKVQAGVAAGGVAISKFTAALALGRAAVVQFITVAGPWIAVIGGAAAAFYFLRQRTDEATEASERYRKTEETANEARDRATRVMADLAGATGQARVEALKNVNALRQETSELINNAKAAVAAARAKAKLAGKANSGLVGFMGIGADIAGAFGYGPRAAGAKAEKDLALAEASLEVLEGIESELKAAGQATAPATVPQVATGTAPKGSSRSRKGRTGPSAEEIEARFIDEQIRLEMEALSARERLALNLDDRVDLQYEMLELERDQRLKEIEQNEDFSAAQKDALRQRIEALYGIAAQVDEQGNIIANGNRGLLARQIEQERTWELERQAEDMARVKFDSQRDLLQIDLQMADTQGERARIADEILALEQEYRRNQLEMVLASAVASDAEKKRAQAILDSLAAIEAGERAASARANETDGQRYMRGLNMTGAQMSEEIERIKINGLERLNDALTDAIVNWKSLGDAVTSVVKSIVADLLRLSIQQSIIKPLANALNIGGSSVPGFATGTGFAPGGLAIVGERGPELVNLPRGSRVYTNGVSKTMLGGTGGGNGWSGNMYVTTPDADSFRRSDRQVARGMKRRLNQ